MNSQQAIELPVNIDAEQSLLGAIFLNNECYHLVAHMLKSEHFAEPIHAEIYTICSDLIARGRSVTPVTVRPFLQDDLLPDLTTDQYLALLASNATTVINAIDYAGVVYDYSVRRALLEIATEIKVDVCEPVSSRTSKDTIEDAEKALFALAETGTTSRGVSSFADAASEAIEMANAAYKRDGGLSGAPSGLSDLDHMMGGLQDSDLIILAARPGMGKTSMATNIAFSLASKFSIDRDGTVSGARVLFFSLEMSREQLATRIISDESRISSSDIRRGNFNEQQFASILDATKKIKSIPLHIDDKGGQNIGRLISTARRIKRQRGVDMVIVDYIQLLAGTTKRSSENRVQEITEITTKLKGLAKELDIPIIALSQLSRQVENRDDKRPKLSDLRDSGSIEQDADVVLFLYREEYYLSNSKPEMGGDKYLEWQSEMAAAHGKAEVIISKQRHGPTGIIDVHFDSDLTKFSNLARPQ